MLFRSRPELARRSGLTKPTVAAIVEDLIRADIVRELGYSDSTGAGGRPARLLELNADAAAYLVVQRNLGSDSLQRWLAAAGWDASRFAAGAGYRVLRVQR